MDVGFFSSTIVQVAISIVISWALFALLCSMILEIGVQIKSERGRFFRNKIIEKLFDFSNQINWGLLMYNNSNIRLLTKSEKAPPTEINSKTLAEVLIDSVANVQAAKILQQKDKGGKLKYKNNLLNNFEFSITYLGQSDLIRMLKNAMNKAKLKAANGDTYNETVLYDQLVTEVTVWFDQFNERTSSWYKKLSRKRLFFIGLLVSTIVNVDSIALFKYYESNPAARSGMVDYYLKNQVQLEALSAKYDSTLKKDSIVNKAAIDSTKNDIKNLSKQIDSLKSNLDLPIGWKKAICVNTKNTGKCICSPAKNTTTDTKNDSKKEKQSCPKHKITLSCILLKIFGIIISAFAASLGAPFWFDLLRKATSVSQSVIKAV
ncbi:hypothetical protein [uncultured Flavobacterium sp.]|uniref:hypothetical protein n=1 Tax=uncultured Flavobacterium sp. TaxID=165435 RepID=UPI00292F5CFD|nr:hypothetical protein [uncultured Flavobacterium sp.]